MQLTSSRLRLSALLLSLLLHALMFTLPVAKRTPAAPASKRVLQMVTLQRQPAPQLPTPEAASAPATTRKAPAPATKPEKLRQPAPTKAATLTVQAPPAGENATIPVEPPAPASAPAPAVNFAESARAAAGAASRAVQSEAWQQNGVLRPKEAHRNLKKPEEELTTALGRDFEQRFGAEVVLSVEEHQEGTERMTIVRTNKGMRCGYTRLVNPQYMGNFPMITRWGDCAKTP